MLPWWNLTFVPTNKSLYAPHIFFSVQIQINMEMTRGQLESKATQLRDKAEIRELLHYIVQSTEDMKALINMQNSRDSRPVEVMMESLQTVGPVISNQQHLNKDLYGFTRNWWTHPWKRTKERSSRQDCGSFTRRRQDFRLLLTVSLGLHKLGYDS